MALYEIKKGLDVPIAGEPAQVIHDGKIHRRAALLGSDFIGMKPQFRVEIGEYVKLGQPLFDDKKMPGVCYTSPGSGTISAIHRGERRVFLSIVIELEGDDHQTFESYIGKSPFALHRDQIKSLLLESGLWTAFRQRPFGKVANPEIVPRAIFITAIDTNPLAASVDAVLKGQETFFESGVHVISKLTDGKTFVCKAPNTAISFTTSDSIQIEEFSGVHPAGNAGVHIHFLAPVSRDKVVFYVNYQDVIAIGKLFSTGRLDVERIVSLAGPCVKKHRLLKTRIGASVDELVADELEEGDNRVISGSVLSGRQASGEVLGYLGRYHHQISVIQEARTRDFLGWMQLGKDQFSSIRAVLSRWLPTRKFELTTNQNGSARAMVPIGMYERVMPMDLMPTFLLRSMIVGDIERAEQLGILELEEEDLALCTFVCPGKYDYGSILRENLTKIEKEG